MSDDAPVGHDAFSDKHALLHLRDAAKFSYAAEGIRGILRQEKFKHATQTRSDRISALTFVCKLLDHLIESELHEVHKELTVYLDQKDHEANEGVIKSCE